MVPVSSAETRLRVFNSLKFKNRLVRKLTPKKTWQKEAWAVDSPVIWFLSSTSASSPLTPGSRCPPLGEEVPKCRAFRRTLVVICKEVEKVIKFQKMRNDWVKSDEDSQLKCAGTEKERQNQKWLKRILKVKGREDRRCLNRGYSKPDESQKGSRERQDLIKGQVQNKWMDQWGLKTGWEWRAWTEQSEAVSGQLKENLEIITPHTHVHNMSCVPVCVRSVKKRL